MSSKLIQKALMAVVITVFLLTCGLPSFDRSRDISAHGIGDSNKSGEIIFQDSTLKRQVSIQVVDSETNQPLERITIEYISNSEKILIVAYDNEGSYLPALYEGKLSSLKASNVSGVRIAHAQGLAFVLLKLRKLKSLISAANAAREIKDDIKNLWQYDRPLVAGWNWTFREECWSHSQLQKGLGAVLKGVKLIIPDTDPFSDEKQLIEYEDEIDQLVQALMLITDDAKEEGLDAVFDVALSKLIQKLPDPVLIRIYFVPLFIPTVTVRVTGPCKPHESTPMQAVGGFATLIAQQPRPTISSITSTPHIAIAPSSSAANGQPTLEILVSDEDLIDDAKKHIAWALETNEAHCQYKFGDEARVDRPTNERAEVFIRYSIYLQTLKGKKLNIFYIFSSDLPEV